MEIETILIGYFFSIIVGYYVIGYAIGGIWKTTKSNNPTNQRLSHLQGVVERTLYTSGWLVKTPEIIAVWLALKVASQWKHWKEEPTYNIFLIGTGLSVMFGVVGGLMPNWIQNKQWDFALIVPVALCVFAIALKILAKK